MTQMVKRVCCVLLSYIINENRFGTFFKIDLMTVFAIGLVKVAVSHDRMNMTERDLEYHRNV